MFAVDKKLTEGCFTKAKITDELCASSIVKYRSSLKKFFAVVGKRIEDLRLGDFDDFTLRMKENSASNARIANIIAAVKWVLKKVQAEGVELQLQLDRIQKPRISKKEVLCLTEEEITRFIGCIKDDIKSSPTLAKVRFMALAVLLLQTGARIGEALSIDIADVDRENMEVSVVGKGGKQRTLFLREETLCWVDRYLSIRGNDNAALFATLKGKAQWQQTDVGRAFRRYRKKSGINKKFTPHTLRHTYATMLLGRSLPLNSVQFLLGHANPETTLRHYIGAVEKNRVKELVRNEHFNFIPRDALKDIQRV